MIGTSWIPRQQPGLLYAGSIPAGLLVGGVARNVGRDERDRFMHGMGALAGGFAVLGAGLYGAMRFEGAPLRLLDRFALDGAELVRLRSIRIDVAALTCGYGAVASGAGIGLLYGSSLDLRSD